ncbi:MAG TPA: hypothetical protein VF736_14535 [Pyrinomonadaceae bacterium]|jgi:hypothetical protein
MSKLTQIESALRAVDPAGFQRLADSYLHRRGYEAINPLGLVTGAEKVAQGTPDTLISRPDGTYDFAEHSTQQDGLADKFAGDIAKCFNEQKTGIPVGRIHEIVLCHNSRLTPDEDYRLKEECRRRGVLLSIYGLGRIAHDLYENYPGLARDFLSVEVDTGQVLPADDFVAAHDKNALATPLTIAFRFREDELETALGALASGDLTLISGRAGVGKTRLALECCRRYAEEHPDVRVSCIFNRGPDLFQDLRVHFSAPGHYLLLVDDANRVNRFEYALQLLHDQRDDRRIKIVATVRDYALDSTLEAARQFGGGALIELAPFNEEQIKELVRESFGIDHYLYLERIAEIAQGNPRLAVMAARVAERENTLRSIADVSALYDEYFASIRRDISEFDDPSLLQTAGIISFLRVIDRSKDELMGAITGAFGLTAEALWQSARRLHELEVVDMYENEVVKISDQVLSTYLFYLSFFRQRALDFGALLEHFFPRFRHRLIDALNPVLGAFNTDVIVEHLRPHVNRVWDMLRQRGDEDTLLNLMDVFWFVKPTDVLLYVRDKVRALEPAPVTLEDVNYVASHDVPPTPSLLGVLDNFRYADEASLRVALSLLLDYVEKRPAELPLVLKMLTEQYGMTHHSHLSGFYVERHVVDALWESARGGTDEMFSRLFLAVSEPLLHTRFQTHESKSDLVISLIKFDVPAMPELQELRRELWRRIFKLYSVTALRGPVLELLDRHTGSADLIENGEIVAGDAAEVQPFLQSSLDPSEYLHCVAVQDYVEMLDRLGLTADEELRSRFTNETYALSELLFDDRKERRDLGREEYRRVRRERLAAYTASFGEADFETFFGRCVQILRTKNGRPYEYQVHNSVGDVLLLLAERDGAMYETVLDRYLHAGNVVGLRPWALDAKLIQVSGPDRAYEILSAGDYPGRGTWLFGYFAALPPEAVTGERLRQLYALYEIAEWREHPGDMDYLLKFIPADEAVVIRVTRTLVNRAGGEPGFGHALSDIFSSLSDIGKRLPELFRGEVGLLKQAYLVACEAESSTDYDGHAFNVLLDLDVGFGAEWVAWVFGRKERPSRRDDSRDYSFIWRRADHPVVMEGIIDAIHSEGRGRIQFDPYLKVFFTLAEGTPDLQALCDRQDSFLDDLIERRHADRESMLMLFDVIRDFPPGRRQQRIATFLGRNQELDAFVRLSLEPGTWVGWRGSGVPMLQGRVDFLESLLPLLNTVELLGHKQHVESLIERLRDNIEREKRRNFMGD